MTQRLERVECALLGGMPAPSLSFAEWMALGIMRQRRQGELAAMGAVAQVMGGGGSSGE